VLCVVWKAHSARAADAVRPKAVKAINIVFMRCSYCCDRNAMAPQQLVAVMRRLQFHAEESGYERGVTAAMGLRGIAGLMYAHNLGSQPATEALVTKELLLFAEMMDGVMAVLESEPLAQV
jgi:hypothetical protein